MVGLGQKGVARVEGNCLKYLKRGWNRKEGKGSKDFKKGADKLDQGVGALKGWGGGGAGTPLQTMFMILIVRIYRSIRKRRAFIYFFT